ncbi:MAG: DUF4293 domain-containing protein [Bacteroidales bacterium]|nr:DUF4293 domain-containing protein [Bacteroidales bacterium]
MFFRIQTLFLFIGFLAMLLLMIVPVIEIRIISSETLKIYLFHFKENLNFGWYYVWQATGILATIGLLISTFLFKKRVLQMRFNAFVFLFVALFVGGLFFIPDKIASDLGGVVNYKTVGFFFPFVSLITLIFANRAIKEDEIKVRSSGRIR